ncbi:MAG: Hsp20/alpha crystallin family protein [Planctomycetaceae bacterium]
MLLNNRVASTTDPWRVMRELESQWSQQIGDWLEGAAQRSTQTAVRLWTADGQAVVEFDLPGVTADQLDVSVHQYLLTVDVKPREGEVSAAGPGELHTHEIRRVARRQMRLPFAADPQRTAAEYRHGVLRVAVHQPETHRPARIAVKGL